MFRTLLAHLREALHKCYLVQCVRKMCVDGVQFAVSIGCATIAVTLQSWHIQLTYARNIPGAVCVAPPEDKQVKLATRRNH
jgi:hypothetical protein